MLSQNRVAVSWRSGIALGRTGQIHAWGIRDEESSLISLFDWAEMILQREKEAKAPADSSSPKDKSKGIGVSALVETPVNTSERFQEITSPVLANVFSTRSFASVATDGHETTYLLTGPRAAGSVAATQVGDAEAGTPWDGSRGGEGALWCIGKQRGIPHLMRFPEGALIAGVSASTGHALAWTSTGDLYSWGDNSFDCLGVMDCARSIVPVKVDFGSLGDVRIRFASAGPRHCLAIDIHGRLFSWGCGAGGRLGLGDECASSSTPRVVPLSAQVSATGSESPAASRGKNDGARAVRCCAGDSHSAVVTASGDLYTWGRGGFGRLGHGDDDDCDLHTPRRVDSLGCDRTGLSVADVALGSMSTLILMQSGFLYMCGCGPTLSPVAVGIDEAICTPRRVYPQDHNGALTSLPIVEIAASVGEMACIDCQGTVFAWGNRSAYKVVKFPLLASTESLTDESENLMLQISSSV